MSVTLYILKRNKSLKINFSEWENLVNTDKELFWEEELPKDFFNREDTRKSGNKFAHWIIDDKWKSTIYFSPNGINTGCVFEEQYLRKMLHLAKTIDGYVYIGSTEGGIYIDEDYIESLKDEDGRWEHLW